jgi:dGTPase
MVDLNSLAERQEPFTIAPHDARTPDDVDYARVIHCASFRRLQGKTQILNLGDSDFYRTRLTHTLEVAQLAHGIVAHLKKFFADHPSYPHLPSSTLAQAISLTHDLGHPPFGHGGEVALNYCMRDHGGFEGNGQSLRILSRLEKMSKHAGLNLSRRALLGSLKYPVCAESLRNPALVPALTQTGVLSLLDRKASTPPKGYLASEQAVVNWILGPLSAADRSLFESSRPAAGQKHGKALHHSFDASIMNLADDLAYGVHDLEDAISLGLLDRDRFSALVPPEACESFLEYLTRRYRDSVGNNAYSSLLDRLFAGEGRCKQMISRMINHLIPSIIIETKDDFQDPLLRYQARLPAAEQRFLEALKTCVAQEVIFSANVQHLEFKGQTMVVSVFEVLASEPKAFLPQAVYALYQDGGEDLRVICDYVAAMTDGFLLKTYDRLFSPRMGSVFDRL